MVISTRIILILLVSMLFVGCAHRATLYIYSQPTGAHITEVETGKSYGATPVIVWYDPAALIPHKNAEGCYIVKGFEAQWATGARAIMNPVKLCGSIVGNYNISLKSEESPIEPQERSQAILSAPSVTPATPMLPSNVLTADQFNAIKRENSIAARARFSSIGVITLVGKVDHVYELAVVLAGDELGSGTVDCEFPETRRGSLVPPEAMSLHKGDYVVMRGTYGGGLSPDISSKKLGTVLKPT